MQYLFPRWPGARLSGRLRPMSPSRGRVEGGVTYHEIRRRKSEGKEGGAILVSVETRPAKAVRVNVTLPADVFAEIDRYAEAHGFTRSGFLAQAARRAIKERAG
jgi:hypothetical protein